MSLQFDGSMLVGRADRPARSVLSVALVLVAVALAVVATCSALTSIGLAWAAVAVVGCATLVAASTWLEQNARRQRAFVFEFDQHWLRLDFSTPLAGQPRTLVVPFTQVGDLQLNEAPDGRGLLTVDFSLEPGAPHRWREVLAAYIGPAEGASAERVRLLLRSAVGLEAPAASVNAVAPTVSVDTFE